MGIEELIKNEDLLDLIAENVSNRIGESAYGRVVEKGERKIEKLIDDTFSSLIDAAIASKIEAKLNESFQTTNNYGEPIGEAMTLRAFIAARVSELFQKKEWIIGRDGKAEKSSGYNSEYTAVEALILPTIKKEIGNQLNERMVDISKEVKQHLASYAGKLLSEKLNR